MRFNVEHIYATSVVCCSYLFVVQLYLVSLEVPSSVQLSTSKTAHFKRAWSMEWNFGLFHFFVCSSLQSKLSPVYRTDDGHSLNASLTQLSISKQYMKFKTNHSQTFQNIELGEKLLIQPMWYSFPQWITTRIINKDKYRNAKTEMTKKSMSPNHLFVLFGESASQISCHSEISVNLYLQIKSSPVSFTKSFTSIFTWIT